MVEKPMVKNAPIGIEPERELLVAELAKDQLDVAQTLERLGHRGAAARAVGARDGARHVRSLVRSQVDVLEGDPGDRRARARASAFSKAHPVRVWSTRSSSSVWIVTSPSSMRLHRHRDIGRGDAFGQGKADGHRPRVTAADGRRRPAGHDLARC